MTFSDSENLSTFFNKDEFAVEALIQGKIIAGLEGKMVSTSNQVNSCKHTFTCAQADIPLAVPGDKVVIHHQEY